MCPDRWKKVEEIYQSALEQPEAERSSFLQRACKGDEGLLREVEEMLEARGQVGSFLAQPAAEEMGLASGHERKAVSLTGRRVAVYEVGALIGAGGMGQVYRARDTRLRRDVALKVLPEEYGADVERARRFKREAQAASALNHPGILTVYDIGESEGRLYLATEYIEGQTLRQRLVKGHLKLKDALDLGIQIAGALAAAHRAGIVHRDIKPENIMIRPDGLAKVLDFGLARVREPETEEASGTVPTKSGMIMGTAGYMSPEQVQGAKLDERTDIFSFGAVLYEMLSGRRAFQRDSTAQTLAAIVDEEPKPVGALIPGIPSDLDRILRRCLRKDQEHRFQHMGDVRVELEELKQDSDSGKPADGVPMQRRSRSYVWSSIVLMLAACLAVIAWLWLRSSHPTTPEILMSARPLITYPGGLGRPAFSPEGDRIAFHWRGEKQDNFDIWVRLIGPGNPFRLTTNPADDFNPAWSPDGKWIAFFRDEDSAFGVFIVPALGGTERRLTQVRWPYGITPVQMTWSPDNKWLVATDHSGAGQPYGLHLISVETGEKRRLTSAPKYTSYCSDGDASFSPDGHSLAFVRSLTYGSRDVYRLSLTDDYQPQAEPERLTYEDREIYSPVWTRDGRQILYTSGAWWTTGRVVKRISLAGPKGSSGYPTIQESFGEDATDLAISPAGHRLAYSREYWDSNIYRIELRDKNGRAGAPQKFIASTRNDFLPEYSPDGETIAFASCRTGGQEIWLCDKEGTNQRQLTFVDSPMVSNPSWSPDGKTLLFQSVTGGSEELYLIGAEGGSPRQLTSNPSTEEEARWSRDGNWIYFHSDRSGRHEVYRMRASGGEAIQITKDGGWYASESADGKWIYYSKKTPNGFAIWKVPVTGGEESQVDPGPIGIDNFNFVVVDEGIYFARRDRSLEFIDFRTGKTRTICRLDKEWGHGIAISPDRKWMLCTLFEEGLNDLMLVENFR